MKHTDAVCKPRYSGIMQDIMNKDNCLTVKFNINSATDQTGSLIEQHSLESLQTYLFL